MTALSSRSSSSSDGVLGRLSRSAGDSCGMDVLLSDTKSGGHPRGRLASCTATLASMTASGISG
jgi:hypothetical protein